MEPANNPTEPTPAVVETPPAAEPTPASEPATPATKLPSLLDGELPPEAKPAEEAKTTEPQAPEGAPEKYEFTAPEGQEYDPHIIESFSAAAKEANMTQDAAQKFIDKMSPVLAQRQAERLAEVQKGWVDASLADKEFGGPSFKENQAFIAKGRDEFATPELREFLKVTGMENHPEVLRLFFRTGKALSEDSFVRGKQSAADTPENRFFPSMKK